MLYVCKMLYTLRVKKTVLGFFFSHFLYSDICVGGIFVCFIRKRDMIKICRTFHDQVKKNYSAGRTCNPQRKSNSDFAL